MWVPHNRWIWISYRHTVECLSSRNASKRETKDKQISFPIPIINNVLLTVHILSPLRRAKRVIAASLKSLNCIHRKKMIRSEKERI